MKKLLLICLLILVTVVCKPTVKGDQLTKYHWDESREISIWAGGWSKHSNARNMNEVHNVTGLCINWLCYMKFTNSFNDPGEILFVDGRLLNEKFTTAGLRFGLVWGYEFSPMPILIPYGGIGCEWLWLEITYFPDPEEPQEYLAFGVLRFIFSF